MPEGLIVETNWLLDVSLQRDLGSLAIWTLAEAHRIDLFLPSLCIAEAVKAFESQRHRWGQVMSQLASAQSDLRRSALFQAEVTALSEAHGALEELRDQSEISLWQTLHRASSRCTLVELSTTTTDLARSPRHQLTLDPADALVLAVVEEMVVASRCARFMSRDAAFRTPMVVSHLQSRQIEFMSEPDRFLSRYFPDTLRQ